jgi:membrane dipeptidase
MIVFDTHCDTILRLIDSDKNLAENDLQLDLKRLGRLGQAVQVFALCVSPACCQGQAVKNAFKMLDRYWLEIERSGDKVHHCNTAGDIQMAHAQGKVASILSIEGGEALAGELSALRTYYRLGVRSLCLTHNARNELADGASFNSTGGGLTPFGRDVVREMNRLGMLIDISHLAEKGFWDVIALTRQPVIASHSNAKALCPHERNLSDEQLLAIRENGGVVGINYYPVFLRESGVATARDIIAHIDHMAALIGCDHIGLGSDFDGIPTWPADVNGAEDVGNILEALAKHNYSQDDIEKIAGLNFMRLADGLGFV